MDARIIDTITEIWKYDLPNNMWGISENGHVWAHEYFGGSEDDTALLYKPFIYIYSDNDGKCPVSLTEYDHKFEIDTNIYVWIIYFEN